MYPLQSERRPHALTYVETALRLGSLINTCRTPDELSKWLERPPPPSEEKDPKAATGRQQEAKMETIRPQLGPGLPGGKFPSVTTESVQVVEG